MRARQATDARLVALIALGALALHQLRYALAHGPEAGAALAREGHAYLELAAGPVLTLALAAIAVSVVRRAWSGAARKLPSVPRTYVWITASLLVVFSVQELAEGALFEGHASGIAGLVGSGGWLALPLAAVIGALLPEDAIVSDESNTSGLWLAGATAGAPPHDWLTLTGGAIGQGMPLATGAAIACPSRPVVCLEADGSAMYTLSALWTQAREGLDVTTVIFNNGSYAVLNMELARVGADPNSAGEAARSMFDLSRPDLDFVSLAQGMGVPAGRARTAEELAAQFGKALSEPGPHLIEAVVPSVF